jgi:hypothetical protein
MTDNPLLTAALQYAERGWPVFPLRPNSKQPATAHGFHDSTTDAAQIAAWWAKWPAANIGLPTAGMLVVDIDGADNPWPNGRDMGNGPHAVTPRGGSHWLYRFDGHRNTTSLLAMMVDTRGDGGYIVVAPSVVDGVPYRWLCDIGHPAGLPTPPRWITDALAGTVRTPLAQSELGNGQIPEGTRNQTLTRFAGALRRIGLDAAEMGAAMLEINRRRCAPPVADAEVLRVTASIARKEPDQISVALIEDHWGQMVNEAVEPPAKPEIPDPGPIPETLLKVPGFVQSVVDFTLRTAPYPNPVLAFAGALCLQGLLAGRKVRDNMDNRTNLYVLALASSATGKDHPRRVNGEILAAAGLDTSLGDRFASGEGLEDALRQTPAMLFQTDEIDGLVRGISDPRDTRAAVISDRLLTLYSSANKRIAPRKKAAQEAQEKIDQPHFVLFGTAVPQHYYEAMTERVLTGGLFARMVILEASKRYPGQEPDWEPVPDEVVRIAKWWADFQPSGGNLSALHPRPALVPHTRDARAMMVDVRVSSEDQWNNAPHEAARTVWGRVSEQTRKLALVYACSENHAKPEIGVEAVRWAHSITEHQAKRMLWQASQHVADSPHHADCLRLVKAIREEGQLTLRNARRRMKGLDSRQFTNVLTSLEQQGEVVIVDVATGGRPSKVVRLP